MRTKWIFSACLMLMAYSLFSQEHNVNRKPKAKNKKYTLESSTDVLPLNYGYRWLSFPRMERYGDDPHSSESVLQNLSVYPAKEFTLQAALDVNFKKEWKLSPQPHWEGNLNLVQSTEGYKLNISPDGIQSNIILKGARLNPETSITLPGNNESKAIGYFIEESQYPWQAFPEDVYNNKLTMIQAQYWTMVKIPPGGWIISSGKIKPIKYSDMVIVKSKQGTTFIWNDPDDSVDDIEIPKPQVYTWEEKADYIPFFIETDSTSNIAEIAVKVDGECMGATVRQPGDTLVEVDGYIMDLPAGSVVEFETWNGYKATPVAKDGYVIYNQFTRKKEKRNIYVGEIQDYYLVSFKQGEVYEKPDDVSQVTCRPNPFNGETVIAMRLNCKLHVCIEIYDIAGIKVKTLLDGEMPGGYYDVKWYGDNEQGGKVSRGIYFYKIRTGSGTEISEKIVLID